MAQGAIFMTLIRKVPSLTLYWNTDFADWPISWFSPFSPGNEIHSRYKRSNVHSFSEFHEEHIPQNTNCNVGKEPSTVKQVIIYLLKEALCSSARRSDELPSLQLTWHWKQRPSCEHTDTMRRDVTNTEQDRRKSLAYSEELMWHLQNAIGLIMQMPVYGKSIKIMQDYGSF